MLVYAFIGLRDHSKLNHVLSTIRTLCGEDINKLFTVYGEYDILLKLKAMNAEKAREKLIKIKHLEHVNSIKTGIVMHQTHETDVRPKKLLF